jgi:hypothetical protein
MNHPKRPVICSGLRFSVYPEPSPPLYCAPAYALHQSKQLGLLAEEQRSRGAEEQKRVCTAEKQRSRAAEEQRSRGAVTAEEQRSANLKFDHCAAAATSRKENNCAWGTLEILPCSKVLCASTKTRKKTWRGGHPNGPARHILDTTVLGIKSSGK